MIDRLRSDQKIFQYVLRRSFYSFAKRAFIELEPTHDFISSSYLDLLCDKLEEISRGEVNRQIINMPPRHLKSLIVSVAFVAWMLGHRPGMRVVLVSYGSDLCEKHIRAIRQIMKSEWYRKTFPRTRISKSKDTNLTFETTEGGGAFGATIEGQLTGRGGDLFIIDDPIKSQDVQFDKQLASVNDWISNTLLSRMDDKAKGQVIVVMQRLHVADLSGHLLERGGWDHLSLAAIAIDDEAIPLSDGRVFKRNAGEPLFPERETLEVLHKQREIMGSFYFNAQYQQQPAPREGNLLKPEWLKTYELLPAPHRYDEIVQAWDLGVKDGDLNDYSACVTLLYSGTDKNFYVLHVWRGRLLFPDLRAKIVALAHEYKPRRILIEDAVNGPAMIIELQRNTDLVVRGVKPKGAKVDRIMAQSHMLEAGRVYVSKTAPWLDAFLDEYRAFPHGKYDDMLDAFAYALSSRAGSTDGAVFAFFESPFARAMRLGVDWESMPMPPTPWS